MPCSSSSSARLRRAGLRNGGTEELERSFIVDMLVGDLLESGVDEGAITERTREAGFVGGAEDLALI